MQKIKLSNIGNFLSTATCLPPLKIVRAMLAKLKHTTPEYFFINDELFLNDQEITALDQWITDFSNHKPLSKIINEKEFWSLSFTTNEHTLDPRPDSEILIEHVLKHIPEKNENFKILDLGTGTGCLLISLLHELKNAYGVGADISQNALKVAQSNAEKHKVTNRCTFIESNWFKNVEGKYDIIVSNPPYIQDNYPLENHVVLYDPPIALFAGEDGLNAYTQILKDLKGFCKKTTICFFEIGFDQKNTVTQLIINHDFQVIETAKDFGNNDRVIIFRCVS